LLVLKKKTNVNPVFDCFYLGRKKMRTKTAENATRAFKL
jgi:hypothetical protein